jgi:hypothetical protein
MKCNVLKPRWNYNENYISQNNPSCDFNKWQYQNHKKIPNSIKCSFWEPSTIHGNKL